MTHSNLRVEVQGSNIVVAMRGTCLRVRYLRQDAPWLATDEFGPDDPEAPVTFAEFQGLAWASANEAARRLGWIRTCEKVHKAATQMH